MGAGASGYESGSRPGTASSRNPNYIQVTPQTGGYSATNQLHLQREGTGDQRVTMGQTGKVYLGAHKGDSDTNTTERLYPDISGSNNTSDDNGGGTQPPMQTLRPVSASSPGRPRSPYEAGVGEARPRSPRYPPQQQPYHAVPGNGQPPPIGFRADYIVERPRSGSAKRGGRGEQGTLVGMGGHRSQKARAQADVGMHQWDEKRDEVYMRVMSAEEFLGRMWETDQNVKNWSQCEDPQLKFKQLRDLLGLRGHLQDELLRIEAMLAEGDPELRCLSQFEGEYPHVVLKLREINEKNKHIAIREEDIDIHDVVAASSGATAAAAMAERSTQHSRQGHTVSMATQSNSGGHSMGTQSNIGGNSMGTQSNSGGHTMATQSDSARQKANTSSKDEAEVTEEDLKQKHKNEENDVSENFANQFVNCGDQMTQDDVNNLLDEHGLRMQALRKKQKFEKDKFSQLLEQRKQERLLTRRAAKHESEEQEAALQNQAKQKKAVPAASSFYVDFNDKGKKKGKGKNSSHKTIVEEDTTPAAKELNPNDHGPQSGSDPATNSQKPVGRVTPVTRAANGHMDSNEDEEKARDDEELKKTKLLQFKRILNEFANMNTTHNDDFDEDSGPDTEDLRSTLKEDLWTTLRNKTGDHDTFKELLDKFRKEEAERSRAREGESERNKMSLLAKMAERKKQRANGEQSGKEIPTQTVGVSVASFSVGTDDELAQQEIQDIKDVKSKDATFLDKLRKQRNSGQLSDEEFQRLLQKHLDETESLRLSRNAERDRHREKLQEKIKKRKGENAANSGEFDINSERNEVVEKELTILEENLQKDLQNQKKDISDEELQALLEKYRRDQEALLQAKHDNKARSNEKLQQKLEARRRNREKHDTTNEKEKQVKSSKKLNKLDDEFFQEVQQFQGQDGMSEEAFANMLQGYLNRTHAVERDAKRKQRMDDKEAVLGRVQQDASQVVTEHEKQTKQITDIRQREKDITDQKLRKKLMSKKNKHSTKEEDNGFYEADEENV